MGCDPSRREVACLATRRPLQRLVQRRAEAAFELVVTPFVMFLIQ